LFGGANGSKYYNDVFKLSPDLRSSRISPIGTAPAPRAFQVCAYLNGSVLVAGGDNNRSTFGDTYMLDLRKLSWSKIASRRMISSRTGAAHAVVGEVLYVFGGGDGKTFWMICGVLIR
jgi:N-acetylneuraminic acid mutarotase